MGKFIATAVAGLFLMGVGVAWRLIDREPTAPPVEFIPDAWSGCNLYTQSRFTTVKSGCPPVQTIYP